MKHVIHTLHRITIALALTLVCLASAQAEQGRTLRLSTLVTTVPAGLEVTEKDGGAVITDASQSFVAVIKPHAYQNFEAMSRELGLEKDGFQLVGEPQSIGGSDRSFRAARQTDGGWMIADTFVRFSPKGGGAVVLVISKEQDAKAAYYQGLEIAKGIQFSSPSQTAPRGDQRLAAALSGKHLLYLYTGNGYSERKDLFLYPSGQFIYRADAASLSMNGSGALAGGADGQWTVSPDGRLVLRFNNGSDSSFTVAPGKTGNEILLNDRRVFILND